MNEDRPLFILAGNGPYENRGCEAIVRGTVKILREVFGDPQFICLSKFVSEEDFNKQRLMETDKGIVHLKLHGYNKNSAIKNMHKPETWRYLYRHFFNPDAKKYQIFRDMIPYLGEAAAVLSVGGDNYSLDYGVPTSYTGLDDVVLEKKRPIVIWGASVGPFDRMPDYEKYMSHHLKKVTGIYARESVTIEYLKSIGVADNVFPVADPAFVMNAVKPEKIDEILPIDEESIGINLSPLMARYVTGGDLQAWAEKSALIIGDVAEKTGMPVYLIPHVTTPNTNDYTFMQKALSFIQNRHGNIIEIPPRYNAQEMKWIISRMAVFAGARTHSTIAALSSGVPTLSFAYSIKAQGINRDLFGHTNCCLGPIDLETDHISSRIASILDDSINITKELADRIPLVQRAAENAGMLLKQHIGDN